MRAATILLPNHETNSRLTIDQSRTCQGRAHRIQHADRVCRKGGTDAHSTAIARTARTRRLSSNTSQSPASTCEGFRLCPRRCLASHRKPTGALRLRLAGRRGRCSCSGCQGRGAGTAPNPQSEIRRDYELALQLSNKAALNVFLSQHPDGYYANLAKLQLNQIEAEDARIEATEKAQRAEQQRVRLLPKAPSAPTRKRRPQS